MTDVERIVIRLPGDQWRVQKDSYGSFALARLVIPGEKSKDQNPYWELRSWHRTIGSAVEAWFRKHSNLELLEAESIPALIAAEEQTRDDLLEFFRSELEVVGEKF